MVQSQLSDHSGGHKAGAGVLDWLAQLNHRLVYALPGGAGMATPRQVINLHKLSVGPLVLALMFWGHNFTLAAWLYLTLHGLYGVMWCIKDVYFADPAWRKPCSLSSACAVFAVLCLYYIAPLMLLTPLGEKVPGRIMPPDALSPGVAALAVGCFVIGAFFHFVSDCHKNLALQRKPAGLITSGLFSLSRNPNYFGEILIYGAFNLIAAHWAAWFACGFVWLQIFWPTIHHKDRSMSRYPEHADWVRRTPILVPNPFTLMRALVRSLGRGEPR
jgi:protein-S-isoprenylcysteine O-methyltransferase Ste14